MPQTVPLVIVGITPGPGQELGYRVLDMDRVEYSAFSTVGVVAGAGCYVVAGGVVAPDAGGYIVVGYVDQEIAEAGVEPAVSGNNGGSGTGTYLDTVTDGALPLDGVRVQLSTDAAGANRAYETFTDALGVFTLHPDPGTYYRWIDLARYTGEQGVEVIVT